jgi:hypothetical protein
MMVHGGGSNLCSSYFLDLVDCEIKKCPHPTGHSQYRTGPLVQTRRQERQIPGRNLGCYFLKTPPVQKYYFIVFTYLMESFKIHEKMFLYLSLHSVLIYYLKRMQNEQRS